MLMMVMMMMLPGWNKQGCDDAEDLVEDSTAHDDANVEDGFAGGLAYLIGHRIAFGWKIDCAVSLESPASS